MTDFRPARGFEDRWRNDRTNWRPDQRLLAGQITRAQLARIVGHAPEVVVSVKSALGRRRALASHLVYISRDGGLDLEGPEGRRIEGIEAVRELADDWAWMARIDSHATPLSPIARSLVLSVPTGPDPRRVEAAARSFAAQTFGERFDYAFVRHADGAHPHVHLTVRALGRDGERLTPRRPELAAWRSLFAERLRAEGVEAEATPRRVRGVTRPAERTAVVRIRQREEPGRTLPPRVELRLAHETREHELWARDTRDLEARLARDRERVVDDYKAVVRELLASRDAEDRRLAMKVYTFVHAMPPPVAERTRRAAEIRAEAQRQEQARWSAVQFGQTRIPPYEQPGPERERTR